MKLNYKEDPKEWRKSVWLTAAGLALLTSLLRWRKHLPFDGWVGALLVLALVAIAAFWQPSWFRSWYRLSLWLGFYSSQFIGRCVLLLVFVAFLTPLGWALRLTGKDLLKLKRSRNATSYWLPARDYNSLDRLF